MAKKLFRLFLASLLAVNSFPVLLASNAQPADRATVLHEWANALGMSGDLAENELTSIEYWGTGTVRVNGALCTLTDYHASLNYQVPGMRVDFTCVDAAGQSHHEIQAVVDTIAWNETAAGSGITSALSARDARLSELWSGPLALVRAATAAGAHTQIRADGDRTVVTFPVPGVADATVQATLNAQHRAAQVETRVGATTIHTVYSDYAELNGTDLKFDAFFPHHIVQTQDGVTLVDLTVTRTRTSQVDLVLQGPALAASTAQPATVAAPAVAPAGGPATWKHPETFTKLDASLRATVAQGCVERPSVIVRTKAGYRTGLRDSLLQHGSELTGEFPIINAVAARVACGDLETLAGFDSTLSLSVNARVRASQVDPAAAPVDVPETPVTAPSARAAEGQAAAALQAPLLQTLLGDDYETRRQQASTTSIGIAIIDSGIEPGPDFGDRITAFYDFTQGDVQAAAPSDGYGHGTHVAGLAASQYVGVDPRARLIGLKVLDQHGRGSSDYVLRAIEFAIVNKDLLNIQVLNVSLGHPIYESASTDPMVQAVESAVRAGLVVVVAAGNMGLKPGTVEPGYSGIVSPANAPSAFAVGAVRTRNTATRADDQIALFSSRGPTRYDGFAKPDFSAPGQNVLSVAAAGSTLRLEEEAKGNTGNYMRLNGTSMAAPLVSGVVALALETNPMLTPNTLKALLEYSAIDVPNLTDSGSADFLTQGAGAISDGALTLAGSLNTAAPDGARWLPTGIATASVIDGATEPWVQRVLWGNYPMSGADLLDEQRPAWALGAVWGNSLVDDSGVEANSLADDNVVWGNSLADDNVVWGNSLADDNVVWGNSLADDNIVWGNSLAGDNIVWGNSLAGDNIVWGNSLADDNIVWGNSLNDDNIVWGNSLADDNVVWGNSLNDDNIVWGNSVDGSFEDVTPAAPPPNESGGGWLESPGTDVVRRSAALQRLIKLHRAGGAR